MAQNWYGNYWSDNGYDRNFGTDFLGMVLMRIGLIHIIMVTWFIGIWFHLIYGLFFAQDSRFIGFVVVWIIGFVITLFGYITFDRPILKEDKCH